MITGSLWIATGFVIAFLGSLPNGSLFGGSVDLAISTWRLTITGVLGLLLAAVGCIEGAIMPASMPTYT